MRWILNGVYLLLITLLSPVVIWRMVRHGRYRRGIREKLLGSGPSLPKDRPVAWFHAVSVGEVVQMEKIVTAFAEATKGSFQVVVSTSTDTGYDLALKRFSNHTVTWFPLDFSWSVSAALQRIHPAMLVLMELEIWPNLIRACEQQKIPVSIINARMSDRSVRGYRRIRPVIAPILRRLSLVAAQSDEYAQRLTELGARSECVCVTGSIKFDGVATDRHQPKTETLRQLFGIRSDQIVFIAGSTQDPEERYAIDAWRKLTSRWPHLRLILVPRHKERFEEVAELVQQQELPLLRRSRIEATPAIAAENATAGGPVILLDTIGELGACWGLADVAFVGGSFGKRGGQNMIEPAAFGAVIMFGPNTSNFRDVVAAFKSESACLELQEPQDLHVALERFLTTPSDRIQLGQLARSVVLKQQGATRRTIEKLVAVAAQTESGAGRPG